MSELDEWFRLGCGLGLHIPATASLVAEPIGVSSITCLVPISINSSPAVGFLPEGLL